MPVGDEMVIESQVKGTVSYYHGITWVKPFCLMVEVCFLKTAKWGNPYFARIVCRDCLLAVMDDVVVCRKGVMGRGGGGGSTEVDLVVVVVVVVG